MVSLAALKGLPWLRIAGAAVIAICLIGGGFYAGKRWESASWQKKEIARLEEQQKAAEEAEKIRIARDREITQNALALEASLAAERQRNRELARRLDNELKDPAYTCPVPDNGVQLLRESRRGYKPSQP